MGFFDFMKKKGGNSVPGTSSGTSSGQMHNAPDQFSSGFQSGQMPGSQTDGSQNFGNNSGLGQMPSAFSQNSPNSQFMGQGQQGQQSDESMAPFGNDPAGYSPSGSEGYPPPVSGGDSYNYGNSGGSREQEIILSKLDAIRTAIQNLDHRLSAIENRLEATDKQKDRDMENIF